MTESILKAKDYDIKIKFDGKERFVALKDVKINDKPFSEYLTRVEKADEFIKGAEKKARAEFEKQKKLIVDLGREIEILTEQVTTLKNTIKNLIKGGLEL